jgi:hypothetical protein
MTTIMKIMGLIDAKNDIGVFWKFLVLDIIIYMDILFMGDRSRSGFSFFLLSTSFFLEYFWIIISVR